ncbi:MAG: hypothetical protein IJ088_07340 [Clostridia bacterium]|nr:hypothetical protein [Clostridia bacterium]
MLLIRRVLIITVSLLLLSVTIGILLSLGNGQKDAPVDTAEIRVQSTETADSEADSPNGDLPGLRTGNGPILASFTVEFTVPDPTAAPGE